MKKLLRKVSRKVKGTPKGAVVTPASDREEVQSDKTLPNEKATPGTKLRRSPPDIITLYLSHPLQPSTISALKRDFALSAHDDYDPMVRMTVSERTDFYGLATNEIMGRLQQENGTNPFDEYEHDGWTAKTWRINPFLVADEKTTERGEVTYVDRWAEREEFTVAQIAPDATFPVLLKARLFIQEVPVIYVNLTIGNKSSLDYIHLPYDPSVPLPDPEWKEDWRLQPPELAYLSVHPDDYEVSEKQEDREQRLRYFEKPEVPEKVYRLKERVAKELGLESRWTVAWNTPREDAYWIPGMMDMGQPWAWVKPDV
ncbi:hypothetical protein BT69DRAFT_1359098 [Atractiella rhizophila]|nr:hypothetical protein BT69DRAFT_1359098 [Atractiella rhizophila]